jgi:hypothetical protein
MSPEHLSFRTRKLPRFASLHSGLLRSAASISATSVWTFYIDSERANEHGNHFRRSAIGVAFLSFLAASANAQGTLEDYERAQFARGNGLVTVVRRLDSPIRAAPSGRFFRHRSGRTLPTVSTSRGDKKARLTVGKEGGLHLVCTPIMRRSDRLVRR